MRNAVINRIAMAALVVALAGCSGSNTGTNSASSESGASGSGAASGNAAAPAKAPAAPPIVVAEGTVIPVTLDQSVGTKNSNVGDGFDASVAAPVTVDGKTAIPKGAKASGHVTVADQAGRVKGGARLELNLDSVTVGGEKMQIHTSAVVEEGKGRGKRTAVGAGGGAAVGAIIGAIAGGGKGAAIGAGAGAGAGTAGAVFTGNRDITLPAETKLNFKLTDALEMPAK
jgi:hypothetical protein